MITEYNDIKYFDEDGKPSTAMAISKKHKVSRFKVRDLFSKHSPEKVYQLIGMDQRKGNGQRNVYFNDDGISTSSESLGELYKVSRSTVQRIYRANKKDFRIANPILARFHD